jgi:aminoglycoside phosphotransferase (APT) family kinase protein
MPRSIDHLDVALVRGLLADQFPQWAHLAVLPVEPGGWDNKTFRLGEDMSVRLPTGEGYALQVDKEHRWLPRLAPQLRWPIPRPLAKGAPSERFPLPWSVYGWIDGEVASTTRITDMTRFARDVGAFLVALQAIDAHDGPPPGRHNSSRGRGLAESDSQVPFNTPGRWGTSEAIAVLGDRVDGRAATEVWQTALSSRWQGARVWVHGDVAATNLLVRDGRLSAVIDFGCLGVGDPACDLVIAWTFFSGESRAAFRDAMSLDDATWARARGWAVWKALIVLEQTIDDEPQEAAAARRVLEEVIADRS